MSPVPDGVPSDRAARADDQVAPTVGQLRILIVLLVVLLGAGGAVWSYRAGRAFEAEMVITGSLPDATAPQPAQPKSAPVSVAPSRTVVVHVVGAVRAPGVYRLSAGSRGDDAVKAAGGALHGAQLDSVNLAEEVRDGQQLFVPSMSHPAPPTKTVGPAERLSKGATVREPVAFATAPAKLRRPGEGTVNLNTATAAELQRLPGIGPAMAGRIIDHRAKIGRFAETEQLMDVSGIGDKKFAKMKPFVTVR